MGGGKSPEREGPVGSNNMSFEEFEARTYREPESGVYIVSGDTPIPNREALQKFYQDHIAQGALTLHQENGVDQKWDDTQKLQLTYCVSTSFGPLYSAAVAATEAAVNDWESAANVNFIHLSAEDANCDASNLNVLFDVSPAPDGAPYLARAFFPGFPRSERNILIAADSFGNAPPYTAAGIMKHEVGHTLGFRHEHIRAPAGFCYEDDNWRALTGYDAASVMHYPFCDGTNEGDLEITAIDRDGAASLYGGHPICVSVQEGVSGTSQDAHIHSKKPNKNFNEKDIEVGANKGERQGLLRFDLSGIPSAARVQSATVTLHQKTNGDEGLVEVHAVTAAWNEQTVTYNSFGGAFDPEVSASFSTEACSSSGFVSFDATALAKKWVKGPNNGLLLDETGDRTRFKSSENNSVTKRPRLEVCYLPPASPPPSWTCAANQYGTGDGCDCNCGFADLDCFQPDQAVQGCGPNEVCTANGTCKAGPPPEWTCPVDAYDSGGACNCECGAPDPDCEIPWQQVVGCPDWTYVCDENGQCQAPVCGDGVVSGAEQCDPPDGVFCDANCNIILPPEASCNDLSDDDNDGLYDCQDSDCQALGACGPGTTPGGGACTQPGQCVANGNDPFCLTEDQFGYTEGYCSEYCSTLSNDCAGDGVCFPFLSDTVGICFDACQGDVDCRPGYACTDFGQAFVCAPAAPAFEDCGNGIDDDGDGAVDCADTKCTDSVECAVCGDGVVTGVEECDPPDGVTCDANCQTIFGPEASCNDLVDDDQDGQYDCQDADCQAAGVCTPGSTPTGGACTSQNDCTANANDPFCLTETQFGWPGGTCSEYCNPNANDCAGDAICLLAGIDVGLCVDGCVTNADCRPGYSCNDFGLGLICAPF